MKSDTVYIGVDVSKAKLDVYVPPKKEGLRAVTRELGSGGTDPSEYVAVNMSLCMAA